MELYVRRYYDKASPFGPLSCEGLPLTTFKLRSERVQIRRCKDGDGQWQRVVGLYERFMQIQPGPAYAVRVEHERWGEAILIYGGQYGILFGRCPTPILWVEAEEDIPRDVLHRLVPLPPAEDRGVERSEEDDEES